MPHTAPSLLAVCDTESYLKWAAQLLARLGDEVRERSSLVLLRNPIEPSPAQTAAALSGSGHAPADIEHIGLAQLPALLADRRPDIVLGAATGPVVERVFAAAARGAHRPALLSGLPGIGLPARARGLRFRSLGDVFITHSHAEQAAYQDLARRLGLPTEILVTRLPMIRSQEPPRRLGPEDPRTVLFAPQSVVPPERGQRLAVLDALIDVAEAFPERRVVIKVRALGDEQQTHFEEHPFPTLLAEREQQGRIAAGRIEIAAGPLADFLTPGTALVTVSSTAALESIDSGLPTGIISDFGMNEEMLTLAFLDSGMEIDLADLRLGHIPFPDSRWLEDNYFHAPAEPLREAIDRLADRARRGDLATLRTRRRTPLRRSVRSELRLRSPEPVIRTWRRLRRG